MNRLCPKSRKSERDFVCTEQSTDSRYRQGFLALFAGDTGEIKAEIREQVAADIAPLPPGVVGLRCTV